MPHLHLVASDRGDGDDTPSDPDPFLTLRRADLHNHRFGIDGAPPYFWGYTHPGHTWNGWAVPRFCREVTELIASWATDAEDTSTWWWAADVLHLRLPGSEDTEIVEPDALGLYRFDGWCWSDAGAPLTSATPGAHSRPLLARY